jgi:hypothetical protein
MLEVKAPRGELIEHIQQANGDDCNKVVRIENLLDDAGITLGSAILEAPRVGGDTGAPVSVGLASRGV